jgi:hypothetical protein
MFCPRIDYVHDMWTIEHTWSHMDGTLMLELAQETLRKLGLEAEVIGQAEQLGRARVDARLRIRYRGHEAKFLVQMRREVKRDTLDAIILALEPLGDEALLITQYVPPDVADTLKKRHIAYLDLAGNVYLERPPMLVWVAGQRRAKRETAVPRTAGRAFKEGGLPVVLALICHPDWVDKAYRELAKLTGVAHGTIGNVMIELQEAGFVDEVDNKRRLLQREQLLDQWVEAMQRVLRPKTLINRYRAERHPAWDAFDPIPYGVIMGGELAAARLTGYLRPEIITFYGQRAEPRLILDLGLRPDPGGTIEIRKKFWGFAEDIPGLTPLPLIYADLLATGDARCIETAKLLKPKLNARP